jgi:hypothetical protein
MITSGTFLPMRLAIPITSLPVGTP